MNSYPLTRPEHDLRGDHDVPADAYYGIHTARAVDNFPISGIALSAYPRFIEALAIVKQAAAQANGELGLLDLDVAEAIVAACRAIRDGALHDQFVVDVIQGGAGTSTNMNANEVIANRALELLGRERGDYRHLHPLEHVNLGQSTNDVYPTAIKLALDAYLGDLLDALDELVDTSRRRRSSSPLSSRWAALNSISACGYTPPGRKCCGGNDSDSAPVRSSMNCSATG
jgi:aspartate ammonia-lyase